MKKFIFFILLFSIFDFSAHAYDTFHPEANETLEKGKAWVDTTFKKEKTKAIVAFRAWFPFSPEKVWLVLTDTNNFKNVHSDYADSRTLDRNQFELIKQKKPSSIEAFYEIIGPQNFPSFHGRRKNGTWNSYVFQKFNFPWPLKDRWNVMHVKNDESKAHQGEYIYTYRTIAGNFKKLDGYWKLLPVKNKKGWTEFRGEYQSDPGISVPQFLAKTVVKSSVRKAVKTNTRLLEMKYGSQK